MRTLTTVPVSIPNQIMTLAPEKRVGSRPNTTSVRWVRFNSTSHSAFKKKGVHHFKKHGRSEDVPVWERGACLSWAKSLEGWMGCRRLDFGTSRLERRTATMAGTPCGRTSRILGISSSAPQAVGGGGWGGGEEYFIGRPISRQEVPFLQQPRCQSLAAPHTHLQFAADLAAHGGRELTQGEAVGNSEDGSAGCGRALARRAIHTRAM
jgi:hypothetical protein